MQGGDNANVIAPGLPNILGQGGSVIANTVGGCFYYGSTRPSVGQGNFGIKDLNMDASRSSSVYGNSLTVQPPALVLIPQIKF